MMVWLEHSFFFLFFLIYFIVYLFVFSFLFLLYANDCIMLEVSLLFISFACDYFCF